MRRTQIYLDEDLRHVLEKLARQSGKSISELVRYAVRQHYFPAADTRKAAMLAVIGMRRDRPEFSNPEAYIRSLRRGTRLDRL